MEKVGGHTPYLKKMKSACSLYISSIYIKYSYFREKEERRN